MRTRIGFTTLTATAAAAALLSLAAPAFADDPTPADTSGSGDPIAAGPIDNGDGGVIYYGGTNPGSDCVSTEVCTTSVGLLSHPELSQTSKRGIATLKAFAGSTLKGKRVVFFARTNAGHGVRSLGSATIGTDGFATRVVHLQSGQKLRAYAKVVGVSTNALPSLYSRDVAFTVK